MAQINESGKELLQGLKDRIVGKKAAIVVTTLNEPTRQGIHKAYAPQFLYRPPFGFPRASNLAYIRHLAEQPYVQMCIETIVDELCAIDWSIRIKEEARDKWRDEDGSILPEMKERIEHVRNFFTNPNENHESFKDVFIRMPVRDMLEVGNGVLIKVFNLKEELVAVVAKDAVAFTKNPDAYGMFGSRDDIILSKRVSATEGEGWATEPFTGIPTVLNNHAAVRQNAAYFQYGWMTASRPVPFGKREIIWLDKEKRTDDYYSKGPVQLLYETLQLLMYSIRSDLDYFNNNNTPRSIIGFEGANTEEIRAFVQQLKTEGLEKDEFDEWRRNLHKTLFTNFSPRIERIELTSQELQLIEKQKWYTKMAWSMFGVTPTELGYTEDAKGQANQIVQSRVFRKKAINPLLDDLQTAYTHQIIGAEFAREDEAYGDLEFAFDMFDVDEERNRQELRKLQLETIYTPNELRMEEGLEPLEDEAADHLKSTPSQTAVNIRGFQERMEEAEETGQARKVPESEGKAMPEGKPFSGYSNFDECVRKNRDKEDPEAYCAEIQRQTEGKALTTDNPLTLGEGETPSSARLARAISHILKLNEKKIKELLEQETKPAITVEGKNLRALADRVKKLLDFSGLKDITAKVVKKYFLDGWEESEKKLDRNFIVDTDAINYLQEYTFENIKGMTEDLADKLRGELKRGYMAGEGIGKLKKRVEKAFDISSNRAEAIARTETNRASNFGKLGALRTGGAKGKKKWVSKIDSRTSAVCKRLNGQEVGLDEDFEDKTSGWSGPCPPSHVSCRSSFILIPED